MAFDRRLPEDPERVEQAESRVDLTTASSDDPWSKSDAERDQGFAEARRAVRDHLAENPRTAYGRSSEADVRSGDEPPDDQKSDDAEEVARAEIRVGELRIEGHGPQRHLDGTDDQLRARLGTPEVGPDGKPVLKPNGEVRARDHIDPMTGTTVDGVHGRQHQCGARSTAFSSPVDFASAEAYLRAKASEENLRPEATIEEVLGKDGGQRLRGYRHDRAVAGRHEEVDFTGGSIKAVYEKDEDGQFRCITLFPQPARGR